MKNFKELLELSKKRGPRSMSVAVAQDKEVLEAIKLATDEKIIDPILVGDREKILSISEEIDLDLDAIEVIDEKDDTMAAKKAVEVVHNGNAEILMKGLVATPIVMRAVLDRDKGLRTDNLISHVAVFDAPEYHKVFFVTDAAMIIDPDLEQKKNIIKNAVRLAKSLDIDIPKIGVLAANEKVSEKMEATVDAEKLTNMNKEGIIDGCIIDGPFALDNAISKESAKIKGIESKVAGDADILLAPTIEAGNILYKALSFLANAKSAGIILGAKSPIVLTSRADNKEAKLNSIALSVLMASKGE